MFEYLKSYDQIYVTGPQRSGTAICSQMIANDTGFRCIDEFEYGRQLPGPSSFGSSVVVQCPRWTSFIENYSQDGSLIVFMIRPITEIIRSQKRINWPCESYELSKYGVKKGPIAQVKYDHWEKQKLLVKHYLEVPYHSLEGHPLWVPASLRVNFLPKQTRPRKNQTGYLVKLL